MSDPAASDRVIVAASVFSTTVASLVTNPLEVIKTKQMVKPLNQPLTVTVKNFVKTHGVLAGWRGAHFSIIVSAAGNSLYFLLYERLKRLLVPTVGHFGFGLAAFVSRVAAVAVMLPVEVLKTRAFVKAQGTKFWSFHGLQAQVWRDVIWSTVFWQLYEEGLKLRPVFNTSEKTTHVLSSSISGVIASAVTHPLDVLKTRLQLHFLHSEFPPYGLRELWMKDGSPALYTGVTVRCLRSSITLPVFILAYTASTRYFKEVFAG